MSKVINLLTIRVTAKVVSTQASSWVVRVCSRMRLRKLLRPLLANLARFGVVHSPAVVCAVAAVVTAMMRMKAIPLIPAARLDIALFIAYPIPQRLRQAVVRTAFASTILVIPVALRQGAIAKVEEACTRIALRLALAVSCASVEGRLSLKCGVRYWW